MIVTGVIIMAAIFYVFTVPMINHMAFKMEERAGLTVLDNMYLLVKQSYMDLDSWKESATDAHKRELRNIISVVQSYIKDVEKDIRNGTISLAKGQRKVLAQIRSFKYGNNDYVWVSDYSSRLISHPDPKLNNADFSKVKDVNGDLIVPPMVEGARTKGSGFYSYWWRRLGEKEPVEKLSYYLNIPEWKWVIGTGVYIDDIKNEVEGRRKELISELRKHLHKIQIAGEGYLYIFDSNKNMIIHPNPNIENTNFSDLLDPDTHKPIGDELIALAGAKDPKLEYKWDKPSDPGNYKYGKISWVRYFKGTDWYICSSVYTEDLRSSANALTHRILLVTCLALIISIIGGYFLVNTFTSPIKRLAESANRISKGDLTTTAQFNRDDEIGVLARAFNNMVDQLRDQIKNLEERVTERTSELSGWVDELEQRNQEIETINNMGDMLQACRTGEEVHKVLINTVKSLFPKSTGHLMVLDKFNNVLETVISWNGDIQEAKNQLYEPNDCWSIRRGKTYVMNDRELSQMCRHVEHPSDGDASPYICVPMIAQGEIMGILHVNINSGNGGGARREIDENKRHLAETVAEHAGLSLANIKLHQTLHERSIKDVLTGLYNRRHVEEILRLEQHRGIRHGNRIGILLMDVDNFKQINDTYGHDAGDEVLRKLGALLQQEFREEDTACRYGGEEFMVVLPYADIEACRTRAERLRERVEQDVRVNWQAEELAITLSVGVAVFPDQGRTVQQVIEAADTALYRAKQEGKNRVCVV